MYMDYGGVTKLHTKIAKSINPLNKLKFLIKKEVREVQ